MRTLLQPRDQVFSALSSDELGAVTGAGVMSWVKGAYGGYQLANKMYGEASWDEIKNSGLVLKRYFDGEFDPPA